MKTPPVLPPITREAHEAGVKAAVLAERQRCIDAIRSVENVASSGYVSPCAALACAIDEIRRGA